MGPDDNLSNEITYTDKKVNVKHDSTQKINGDLRVTSKAEVLWARHAIRNITNRLTKQRPECATTLTPKGCLTLF